MKTRWGFQTTGSFAATSLLLLKWKEWKPQLLKIYFSVQNASLFWKENNAELANRILQSEFPSCSAGFPALLSSKGQTSTSTGDRHCYPAAAGTCAKAANISRILFSDIHGPWSWLLLKLHHTSFGGISCIVHHQGHNRTEMLFPWEKHNNK